MDIERNKFMIIGIDGNEANVIEPVGVSVYTLNLLRYFHKKANSNLKFRIYLKKPANHNLPLENDYFKYRVVFGPFLWSQIFLPINLIIKNDLDVFFSPAHYAPRFCPCPIVVTIHDLAYFYYPNEFLKKDLYKLQKWTEYSVKKAGRVIAVSENTKKDVIKFYKVHENKISVVYNGYEKEVKGQTLSVNRLALDKYILYVGTLQPRKNVTTLIRAFSKFVIHNSSFKLLLVGKKGWLYKEIFTLVKQLKLEEKVIFTGYVSDNELVQLYQNAFCFVLPSLYEGFGMPILEAFSYSCPVISSNASCLPEIGRDACLYFDPKSEEELVEKLNLLKNDPELRKKLVKKGGERIKNFSWQKSAEATLEVLKDAVNEN